MTCALATPPRTARTQASILGTMPASRDGSIFSSSLTQIQLMRESVSGQLAYRPATSVRITSFWAPSAWASAAAAVSALRFRISPLASGATVEMTGMRPVRRRSSTAPGLMEATSPTSPTSSSSPSTQAWRSCAVMRPPSPPDRPTA